MSCIGDKITEDLIGNVTHPKKGNFTIKKDSIFIPDTVLSENGSTYGVVKYVEQQLNKRYAELYGTLANDNLGQLTSLVPFNDGIRIDVVPSKSVEKAIEYKQGEATREELKEMIAQELAENEQSDFEVRDQEGNQFFDQEGNVYATLDDAIAAFEREDQSYDSFFPLAAQTVIQPNYEDYIIRKQELIKRMDKQVEKLYNEKRNLNTHGINKRISRFTKIKEQLELDVARFTSNNDKHSLIQEFFNKDFDLINSLLEEPSLDNLFLAKDLFKYIKNTADIRLANIENKLFTPKANTTYSPEVLALIASVHERVNLQERDIEEAVDKVFMTLLEKNQQKLESLYPDKNLEEIKEELLKNLQDITWIESMFFGQGENVTSSNNIIENLIRVEYEKEVVKQEGKAQTIIADINASLPAVEKHLALLGKKIKSTLGGIVYSGYDYRFLYQVDKKGDYKSSLIGKYSLQWENFIYNLNKNHNNNIYLARQMKDWAEVEKLLIGKFNDLNDKSNFVNFTLLHDIFNDPIYDEFKKGTDVEAKAYKDSLIRNIGFDEYQNVIEEQRNLLDNYLEEVDLITEQKLLSEGVADVNDLSDAARQNLNLSIARLNPATFLESFLAGRKGMIEYTIGTQSNEKPSYLKYNTVVPARKSLTGKDTGFYDANFDMIEDSPALYALWAAIKDGTKLINENLIDSNISVKKNSLLLWKKQFAEESVNKDAKSVIKQGLGNMLNLKQFIKDIGSAKLPDYTAKDTVVLPAEVKSFNAAVHNDFEINKTELANILGTRITDETKVAYKTLSLDQQKKIYELFGFTNSPDFERASGGLFKVEALKRFSEKKIMDQQTLNTPLMIKALLEFSAEHRAKTNSLNEVNIYREKSNNIRNQENTLFSKEGTTRKSEVERSDFFYKTVLLNQREKDHSGNITKILTKWADKNEWNFVGRHFYKNFKKDEKVIYDSATKRLAKIEEELADPAINDKVAAALLKEQEDLNARIRLLGKDYLASAVFDNVVNKLSVQVGLGFNILANIKNRMQGLTSLITRDGEFWQRGNIYPVNHFIGLNKTRFVNPSYKEEWDKANLFIRQLNLIQDGTNEIQRAENKIKSKVRFLNPMYGTEVVEWYNQSSGILAMAMDVEVTGTNSRVPLFDGSTFPAFDIVDGTLRLKDEFRNPENIAHFEDVSSEEMINWKAKVEDMTRSLNGDYSKTGVTRIKGSIFTTPIMMFKTWIPKYISSRYRIEQKNILTGETETGYLVSTFLNKKTSFSGGMMLAVTGLLGILSSSPAIIALPIFTGVAAMGLARHHLSKKARVNQSAPFVDDTEPIAILQQAMYVLKSLTPWQLAEMPVNSILGKQFIKPVEFKGDLTPKEQSDVRLMMRNMQNAALLMLTKLAIQAFLRFNDEDEPKGKAGSEQRKRYEKQQEEKEKWQAEHNFLENLVTGLYQETSLAVEPTSLLTTMGSKNGLQGPIDKIIKASTALANYNKDEIQKGARAGQSKTGNAFRKWLLPSLFRDLGHDTWRAGFESSMEKEWVNNEGIDGVFDSQYKIDKKEATGKRSLEKLHYLQEYEEKNNVNMEDLSTSKQDKIEKKANRTAKKASPNPDRKDYDEEQELKDE